MRETLIFLVGGLSALSFLWTYGSIYFVFQLELPPRLDPIGIMRTIALAPGYLAISLGDALAQLSLSVSPWTGAFIVAIAIASISSLVVTRLVMNS
jgi:hypothetical protein